MRFRRLELRAFGPFADLVLDFGAEPGRLHVLYGRNEAGKSTALRAITGLLFGIPVTTRDAHRHKAPDLRVGARLEDDEGRAVDVVRRKGNKSTLLGPDGAAIDEAPLRRLLGGVSEAMFRTMFGLDHETLRQGAEALLEGKGDMGESLFGAGFGGAGLHRVLGELRAEADEIFTPLSRTKELNKALLLFDAARKESRLQALEPDAYLDQKRGLEAAIAERARQDEEARELAVTLSRRRRAQRALPLLAKRRVVIERRSALGAVILLPESATKEREEAQREALAASTSAAALTVEIAELEARSAALQIPRSLLDDARAMEELPGRLGSHQKAAGDLPKLEAELGSKEEALEASLRAMGSIGAERSGVAIVDPAAHARVLKLGLDHGALVEKERIAARAEVDAEARLDDRKRDLEEIAEAGDAAPLRDALERARVEGDLGQRLRAAENEVLALERRVDAGIAGLGLFVGSAEELVRLAVPPVDAIERHARVWSSLEALREKREDALEAQREQASALDRDLDEQRRAGHVPTEDELALARSTRDRAWAEIRVAATSGRALNEASLAAFEASARRADEIADRLRREAERVTRLARLVADREACRTKIGEIEAAIGELDLRERAARDAWEDLFRAAKIAPRPPAEMVRWATTERALVDLAEQLFVTRDERASLELAIGARRGDLAIALEALGERVTVVEDLGALISRATRVLEGLLAASRARSDAEARVASALSELRGLSRAHAIAKEELASSSEAWVRAVTALGLASDASPAEAVETIEQLKTAATLTDERDKLLRRVRGIARDAAAFENDVRRLVALHASDLDALPVDAAAAELARRYQQGKADRVSLGEIELQLVEKRRKLAEAERRAVKAEERLAACRRAASAEDLAALEESERRSREARELDQKAADLEDQLLQAGDGASVEELAAEVAVEDADRLAADLEATAEAIADVEQRRRKTDVSIGKIELGLEEYERAAPKAAEQASIADAHLTRARELSSRYARARLAVAILEAEIERYRERNQGPIVTRASELFRRLTEGSLEALRAGYDAEDNPVLVCVRPNGDEVGVEGLSDGTRDQLYLALRLATLERYAATNAPIPLVVDDILIHFDDGRSRAALELLADLAQRTQVLFFTHHARLVELAEQSLEPARLVVHALDRRSSTPSLS